METRYQMARRGSVPRREEEESPEGGWGWVIAISAFFINILVIGTHNAFGILFLDLVNEFHESLFKTSLVGSIAFGCILIFGPFGGMLSNKYGCRATAIVGILIAGFSLLISSFASSLDSLFYSYGVGFGFGTSLCYMQGVVIVSKYFSKRRAMATGIVFCGSALGTLIIAPVYGILSTRLTWRQSLRVLSAIIFTTLLCAFNYRPIQSKSERKQTIEERVKKSPNRGLIVDLSLWKNKAFIVWAIAVGLCKLGYLVPYVHILKHADDLGASRSFGSNLLVALGLTSALSRIVFGRLADSPKVNRLYLSQGSAFLMGLANTLLPSIPSESGVLAYTITLGLIDGGMEILLPVMTLDLVGSEKMTIAWGCLLAVISCSALGPPIAGAIRDDQGNYSGAFYFAGIPMMTSALVLTLIPLWAQNYHQEPATSFLSIDPSKLDIPPRGNEEVVTLNSVRNRFSERINELFDNIDAEKTS